MGDPVAIGIELDRIQQTKNGLENFYYDCHTKSGWTYGSICSNGHFKKAMPVYHDWTGSDDWNCYLDYSFLARYAKACYWIMTATFLFVYWGAQSGVLDGMSLWVNGSSLRGFAILTMLYIPVYAGILYTCRGSRMKGLLRAIAYMIPPLFFSLHSSISSSMCIWIVFYGMILYALWRAGFA